MSDPKKSFPEYFKPKLGFFSYLPSHSPQLPSIIKPRSKTQQKTFKSQSNNHSRSESSFITSGLEYQDPKYYLTRNKSREKSLLKKRAFKPPGPLMNSFEYPYMPNAFTEKKAERPGKSLKNFLVPVKNKLFSKSEYLPDNSNNSVSKVVLKNSRNKTTDKNKPPFLSATYSNHVFSKFPHTVDESPDKLKLSLNVTELPKENSANTTLKQSINLQTSNSKQELEKLKIFKAGTRSTSDVFSRFRYESETLLPFNKTKTLHTTLIQKPFKVNPQYLSGASPNIITSDWALKKEFKLY